MRAYIRQNLKSAILIAFLVIGTIVFISTNELIAKRMPEISELKMMKYSIEKTHVYTGQAVEPKVEQIFFQDKDGVEIIKSQDELGIVGYENNVDAGYASIEISVSGYNGTLILEDAFCIKPAQVNNLQSTQITRENIELTWDKVDGAAGYLVYKSTDNGNLYMPVKEITSGDITTYQDKEIQLNATYMYQVRAYMLSENEIFFGDNSEALKQVTPLATAVIVAANDVAYNSLQIQWEAVDGAAGYQIFRSLTKNGEFEFIGEVADGAATTYTDKNCDCGIDYYYYVKAIQIVDDTKIIGDASEIVSGKPTPNKVHLSGVVSEDRTQVSLSWKKSSGAQGYEIYKNSGSGYTLVQKIESDSTLNWSDSGLNKDAEYSYKIRPYCVVEGTTITGDYSNTFVKEVIIEYNYTGGYGNVAGITQYVGVSYVPGGRAPSGWDCSGFTQWALQQCFGVSIPKPAASQGNGGKSISISDRSAWQPGDILAYSDGSGVSHVALYIGNGQLMHALNSKYDTVVQGVDYYERWDSGNRLVAVKRYH